MSKRLVSRMVLIGLLLLGGLSLHTAFANAGAVTALDTATLAPSDAPSLLGPINEKGRMGWECLPERAAAATSSAAAELPRADTR